MSSDAAPITMVKKTKRKAIKIVEEPVTLADGIPMQPVKVETPRDALRATMMMLMQHVADVHMAVVEIIGEKYGIPQEEIYGAITEHPKWQDMLVNPMIHDLTSEMMLGSASNSETASVASSVSADSGEKKKRGRPKGSKWTDEQKAKAAATRAAKKNAATAPPPAAEPEPVPAVPVAAEPEPVPAATAKTAKKKKATKIRIVESLEEA